ncbi:MAG: hypothetical protein Q7R86_03185 [bacterium]|nr:hypothetical protein [bacterium]
MKGEERDNLTKNDVQQLLAEQTTVILSAVDSRLEQFETRFNSKLDRLMTTLDQFLKRLTDSEDEFIIMKKDVNQIKTVLKEKLGVDLF